jgi:hypothetical protein
VTEHAKLTTRDLLDATTHSSVPDRILEAQVLVKDWRLEFNTIGDTARPSLTRVSAGISARFLALSPLIEFRTSSGTLPVIAERALSSRRQVRPYQLSVRVGRQTGFQHDLQAAGGILQDQHLIGLCLLGSVTDHDGDQAFEALVGALGHLGSKTSQEGLQRQGGQDQPVEVPYAATRRD